LRAIAAILRARRPIAAVGRSRGPIAARAALVAAAVAVLIAAAAWRSAVTASVARGAALVAEAIISSVIAAVVAPIAVLEVSAASWTAGTAAVPILESTSFAAFVAAARTIFHPRWTASLLFLAAVGGALGAPRVVFIIFALIRAPVRPVAARAGLTPLVIESHAHLLRRFTACASL
jgi:hypothetical protein